MSPTGRGLQSQRPREEPPSLYKPPFNLKSPATSLLQKPMNDIGTSENGFVTPRFRGRSAIYSMARTPYSRMHPTDAFKVCAIGFSFSGNSSFFKLTSLYIKSTPLINHLSFRTFNVVHLLGKR